MVENAKTFCCQHNLHRPPQTKGLLPLCIFAFCSLRLTLVVYMVCHKNNCLTQNAHIYSTLSPDLERMYLSIVPLTT